MRVKIIVLSVLFLLSFEVEAKTLFKEADYQRVWCSLNGGEVEYVNEDKTRVDCLTREHAVEFDFAKKWAESVGQALYYSVLTGKRGKVVLIIEKPSEFKYLNRIFILSKKFNFDVEYVTPEIFSYSTIKK